MDGTIKIVIGVVKIIRLARKFGFYKNDQHCRFKNYVLKGILQDGSMRIGIAKVISDLNST